MPMRTVIRTDQKVPVYINNKDVASLMIVNESQQRRMSVQSGLGMLDADLVLRYPEDVDKVADIEQAVTGESMLSKGSQAGGKAWCGKYRGTVDKLAVFFWHKG